MRNQRGAALLVLLMIIVVAASFLLLKAVHTTPVARDMASTAVMARAREALIGAATTQPTVNTAGVLPLPDLGFWPNATTPFEGNAAPTFAGNIQDYTVIGKFPWKSLGLADLRDSQGECLWYVVSGRIKDTPRTAVLNWDTQGQIDIIDGNGNAVADNVAALVVSPGRTLDGQARTLSSPLFSQCGGNYDARNYLDSFSPANAIAGEANYFTGSTNRRVALNANDKRFVMATGNDHYNDRFLMITAEDLFRPLMRRSDFATQISVLLDDADFHTHLLTIAPTGAKGTDLVDCNEAADFTFCSNWREMLLLTALPAPTPITVNGSSTPACTRVLIFGGQKSGAQVRRTAADRANPANYLEGANVAAFATPVAANGNFNGASAFNADAPSTDLLRCLF